MSSNQRSELWNEGLKLVSYCPVCETRYNPMEARMLGQDGETHLLHVQCRKCSSSILSLVLVNEAGASSVGLLTDLSYEDVIRFRSNSAVSLDDVIEVHTYLENGSWERLVGTRQIERVRSRARRKQIKNS